MCIYHIPGCRDTQYLYGGQNLSNKQRQSINNFRSLKHCDRDTQDPLKKETRNVTLATVENLAWRLD